MAYRAAKAQPSRIVRSAINDSVMSWSGCVEKPMGFVCLVPGLMEVLDSPKVDED